MKANKLPHGVNENKHLTTVKIESVKIDGNKDAKLFATAGGTCAGILIVKFFFENMQNKADAQKALIIDINIPFAPN